MGNLFPRVRDSASHLILVTGCDPGVLSSAVMSLGYFVAGAGAVPATEHIVPLEPHALGHITRRLLPMGFWDREDEALRRIFPVDHLDSYTVALTHGVGALRVWYAVRALCLAPAGSIVVFPLVELGLHPKSLETILGLLKTTADTKGVKLVCSTLSHAAARCAPKTPEDPPAFIVWFPSAGFTPVTPETFLSRLTTP